MAIEQWEWFCVPNPVQLLVLNLDDGDISFYFSSHGKSAIDIGHCDTEPESEDPYSQGTLVASSHNLALTTTDTYYTADEN